MITFNAAVVNKYQNWSVNYTHIHHRQSKLFFASTNSKVYYHINTIYDHTLILYFSIKSNQRFTWGVK